jgi:integrase
MIAGKQGLESAVQKRVYRTDRDRLKALQVKRIEEQGIYHDGGGLYLQVSPAGTKSWLFRYRLNGRMREMGLGSFKDFSLAEARERARLQRQLVADKIDPIDQREARSQVAKAVAAQAISFEECARTYHKQEAVHWKNPKHAAQWINTLRDYAFGKIGKKMVHTVGKTEILQVLTPIWKSKPETASRVRQRMRAVLEWAAAKDLYPDYPHGIWVEIPKALGSNKPDGERAHHAACPYSEVSKLVAAVRESNSQDIVKLAFEFTILTAARSGETRGALWSEIDWNERLWVIPGVRMKAKKEHRVPLSARCLEILRQAHDTTKMSPLIFCHPKNKKPFSDAIFTSLLHKGLGVPYTMHGFRSSFRDWGSEKTTHSRELLEVSLAHIPGNSTEVAYWRGDMIERRLAVMEQWSIFATPEQAHELDLPKPSHAIHATAGCRKEQSDGPEHKPRK